MSFIRISILAFVGLLLSACTSTAEIRSLHGRTMGTTWTVRFVSADADATLLQAGIQQRLDQIVAQMSPWEVDSDISQYNRAEPSTWHELPVEFYRVLKHALELAEQTDGAYDPTVGPLVNLWGFGPDGKRQSTPDEAAISAAKSRAGWHRIEVDDATRRILQPGGVELDFSSIAPGFALDQIADFLDANGIRDYLIETGGELRASGHRADGRAWQVAVERPSDSDTQMTAQYVIGLSDLAMGSSGDYRNFFKDQGRRYSHRIDPRTGRPVLNDIASVTVVASDGIHADPMATALSILGVEDGMRYASEHDLAVLFIVRNAAGTFEERMSPLFSKLILQ
jgi:thiamine biosynthesis lipoprotein